MKKLTVIFLTALLAVTVGCESEPTTGDKIRDTGDAIGDAIEDVSDSVGDSVGDAADDVSDDIEDAKE